MEKQPVDDLFARKLRDAEVPVGPDVFGQLQKRMITKPLPVRRAVPVWWYTASAACLIAALLFLYISNRTEQQTARSIAEKPASKKVDHRLSTDASPVIASTADRQREEKIVAKTDEPVDHTRPVRLPTTATPSNQSLSKTSVPIPVQQQTEPVSVARAEEVKRSPATPAITLSSTPVERIERVKDTQKQPTDRTIVLTIEEPLPVTRLASVQSESPAQDQELHQNGLSGLFGKLKQLKNGEVLAKATPAAPQTAQKTRFSRVFSEVKESLKNETTLE